MNVYSFDEICDVTVPVMRHRIACNFAAQAEGIDSVGITRKLIATVPEPEPSKYAKAKEVDLSKVGPE